MTSRARDYLDLIIVSAKLQASSFTPTISMPLNTADSSIDSVSLLTVPEQYIIFYSSIVDGRMWCPVRLDSLFDV